MKYGSMTDEEAIEHLTTIKIFSVQDGYTDEAREALDTAIKAIKNMAKLKEAINDYHNVFMVTNPWNTYEEIPVIRVSDLREILDGEVERRI